MKPEQITAWALEEASAEERQQLEAELRENPQAKQAAEETKEFCHFLLAELRDDSLALTDEQRETLKMQPVRHTAREPDSEMPTPWTPQTSKAQSKWRVANMVRFALAACVTLGAVWTWQAYEAKSRPQSATMAVVEEGHKFQIKSASGESQRGQPVTRDSKAEPVARRLTEKQQAEVNNKLPALGKPVTALPAAPATGPAPVSVSRPLAIGQASTMTPGDIAELKKMQDQTAYGLTFADASKAAPGASLVTNNSQPVLGVLDLNGDSGNVMTRNSSFTINGGTLAAGGKAGDASRATASSIVINGGGTLTLSGTNTYAGGTTISGGPLAVGTPVSGTNLTPGVTMTGVAGPQSSSMSGVVSGSAGVNKAGTGTLTLTGGTTYTGSTRINGGTLVLGTTVTGTAVPATSPPLSITAGSTVVMSPPTDAYYFTSAGSNNMLTTDREQESVRAGWATQKDARSAGESYTRIIENELKDVAREPLSTFSIDMDTASYANMRRFLNQNIVPPQDAVRIEELVNYFPTAEEGPTAQAKEPFAVRVELAPCPWQPVHRLARIGIKGRELGNERKASNLVFLVDVSGSMNEPNKLPLVQQSLRMLAEQLGEGDRVTMVVYAGSSGLVLRPTNGEKKSEILAAIDKLQAGGSTHGSAGIQLAYEQAVAGFIKGGVNRVILCTDGDFNVGVSSPEELEKLITRKAKSGVFLSVLGFGSGNLKDRTMETLADKGNGNYAYIDSLSEARKVLVEQMSGTLVTIAKDVKIQVEFNPAAVRSYRLIGYENRMLAKEDFNDDTKDAGEIGAGHSVVALYEVVPANLPPGTESRPVVDSLKYQAPTISPAQLADAAKSGEMMTVKLRYKAPDSDLSKLIEVPVKDEGKTLTASSEEYKFSAAVAGFGLLLRDSAYRGTLSWETVRRLALDGKGADKLGYRGEFLQLIDKARGLKGQ